MSNDLDQWGRPRLRIREERYHLIRIVTQASHALLDLENGRDNKLETYLGELISDANWVLRLHREGQRENKSS